MSRVERIFFGSRRSHSHSALMLSERTNVPAGVGSVAAGRRTGVDVGSVDEGVDVGAVVCAVADVGMIAVWLG